MAKSTNKRRASKKKAALLVRFHSVSEYERLQKAAAREQAPVKNDIRNYPNVSKFLRDAGDDSYTVRVGSYAQVICNSPGYNVQIANWGA